MQFHSCLAVFLLLVGAATPHGHFDDIKERELMKILLQKQIITRAEFEAKEDAASEILIDKGYCTHGDLEKGEWPVLDVLLEKGVIDRNGFEGSARTILEARLESEAITKALFDEAIERIKKPKPLVEPSQPPVKPPQPPKSEPVPDRVDDPGGEISVPPPRDVPPHHPEVEPQERWSYSPLLSRNYLRGGIGSSDQEWSLGGPQWSGSGKVIFVDGSRKLTESIFAFAEYENFYSSPQFNQDAFIAGAGWDTNANDRVGIFLKGGVAAFSSEFLSSFGIVDSASFESIFVGGGLRSMLTDKCLGEVELWTGDNLGERGLGKRGAVSARIEWLVSDGYGVFIQSLSRAEYSGWRVGVSIYF